jgi:hypothetical protein
MNGTSSKLYDGVPTPPPSTSTPHAVIPRDGWYDGPHVTAFMQAGHISAFIVMKSGDAYDCTRLSEASTSLLWIGRPENIGAAQKMVEEYFTKNGNGGA